MDDARQGLRRRAASGIEIPRPAGRYSAAGRRRAM